MIIHNISLLQVALADVRDFGVKVSTIFPGLVNTAMGVRQGPVERLKGKSIEGGMLIQPEELAECVSFILDMPPGAAVTDILLHTQEHNVAAIRNHGEAFLKEQELDFLAKL